MLTDLRGHGAVYETTADLCIIGAGAAGLAIAQQFANGATRICIVESGGLHYEQLTQDLYAGRYRGQPVDLRDGRVRSFGGSMNHWGGRCGELTSNELAQRPWVAHSGWPLDLDDLQPYYRRAWRLLGLDPSHDVASQAFARLDTRSLAAFAPAVMPQAWRFAPADGGLFLNFGKRYADALERASNVTMLLHANVTGFETDERETHVAAVRVRSLDGTVGRISARRFVLCCSGIENARLLLSGGATGSPGLGNTRDLVGRYFMQHTRALAATLFFTDHLSPIQDVLTEFVGSDGVRYQTGLVLSPEAQQRQRLLNCSAVFQYTGDPHAGIIATQDLWRNLRDGHWPGAVADDVWNAIRDTRSIAVDMQRERGGLPLTFPVLSAAVVVDGEQAPDPESRVTLSATSVDALGSPRAVVDWRISDLERETVRRFMLALGADVARLDIGRLRLESWLDDRSTSWRSSLSETFHYMGTTRMAADANHGVVDVQCRVHGIDNLFIGGSSVFPTGGHMNPTLTIVALALRLADHLARTAA